MNSLRSSGGPLNARDIEGVLAVSPKRFNNVAGVSAEVKVTDSLSQ